jgi:hypothetical protein
LAVCGTAFALCASAAAGGKWVTQTDTPEGFAITVPASLYFVPNSAAKVKSIVAQLKQQNQAAVASVYSQIIESSDVTKFVYEGFIYTPSAPVQPLFTLAVFHTDAANTTPSGLAAVARSSASALQKKGATILTTKVVTLPVGQAGFVQANEGSGATKTLLETYIIGHGSRLYELTFRTTAGSRAGLPTFETITKRFAFA